MTRRMPILEETPGQDSFLDIVANIVGILIILVMVVGLRVQHAPADKVTPPPAEALYADPLESEVARLVRGSRQVEIELVAQKIKRDQLATLAAAADADLARQRDVMNAESQQDFDLKRNLGSSRSELDSLSRQLIAAESTESESIEVESLPTPLSKPVHGKELHFQLRGDRLTFIPLDRLLQLFREDAKQKKSRLREQSRLTETVGPAGGFRMRYTLYRHALRLGNQVVTVPTGFMVRLHRWELLPVSSALGEPVADALAPDSEFLHTITTFPPQLTAITIWTYPESFDAFRQLKRRLHDLGYACAGRPLPSGVPIGGSPKGVKSAAQ